MNNYKLIEIGYDTSIETPETLIRIAYRHAKETERPYEHITTVEKAIEYFNESGFKVEEIKSTEQQ